MKKKDVVLRVPAEVVEAIRLPLEQMERELRKELAVALYQRRVLSVGKARILAQISRWRLEELLGRRRIVRHYTQPDLEEDIQYAFGRQ